MTTVALREAHSSAMADQGKPEVARRRTSKTRATLRRFEVRPARFSGLVRRPTVTVDFGVVPARDLHHGESAPTLARESLCIPFRALRGGGYGRYRR